jgi:hypothetical protein
MLARLLGCIALAALAGAPAAPHAPLTVKYRIDQKLTQDIDATPAGQGKQSLTFSTSSFVSLTFADSAGGKAVRVVVDSMQGDSTAPIPSAVFDSARGAEFRAYLNAAGKLSELEAVDVPPAAARIQGFLSDFFPWVKAGVKAGERWADTSSRTTTDGADSVLVRRVISYRVLARETRSTGPAMRIASDYQSSVAGTQPTPNGPARIEGAGKGSGTYYVSPDGRYLGGDWQLRSALTISGAFANDPLPITITQTTKVTALE